MMLDYQKAFAILFLMLGPFKVLAPFVALTSKLQRRDQLRMTTLAAAMGALILLLAGMLGRAALENFDVSVPVLALTGGIVLFLTALETLLPGRKAPLSDLAPLPEYRRGPAINPLAFPVIVTPYGLAAVIVFVALASGDLAAMSAIATAVAAILLLDWITMIYAAAILARLGTALQILAIVLGVVQAALGLQVIVRSLALLHIAGDITR